MPTRPITGPLTRSPSGGVTGVGVGGFSVGSLFSSGQDGGVYEWGDLSTIYQDAAGTTAGVVGQSDGLTLDKRLGLVRGAELNQDPDFDDASKWGLGAPVAGTIAVADGALVINSTDGSYAGAVPVSTGFAGITIGKSYEYELVVTSISAGNIVVNIGGTSQSPFIATVGTHRGVLLALGTTRPELKRGQAGVPTTATITRFSVRELPGNHASQSTTASKPTLQSGYGAFDRFDDYMTAAAGGGGTAGILLCAGIRAGGAGTARTIWSDTGTNAGYKLTLNASNQLVLSAGNGSAYTSVTGPAITAGTDYVVQAWHNGANLNVRVGLAAATSAAFATATAGTAGFTIGRDNGAATGYYGDRIYCLAYRKNDASTAAERDSLARWAASKSNVTL